MPPGWGVSPEIEARLMIEPPLPPAIIPGATRRTRRNAALRLMSIILSNWASVASSAGPFCRLVALLLTRMSIGPSARSVSRTARSRSSGFPTWQATGCTFPGSPPSSDRKVGGAVVDQDVDRAQRALRLPHRPVQVLRFPHVAGHRVHLPGQPAQLRCGALQHLELPARDRHLRSRLGQPSGDGLTDAAPAPRHEGDAAGERVWLSH